VKEVGGERETLKNFPVEWRRWKLLHGSDEEEEEDDEREEDEGEKGARWY